MLLHSSASWPLWRFCSSGVEAAMSKLSACIQLMALSMVLLSACGEKRSSQAVAGNGQAPTDSSALPRPHTGPNGQPSPTSAQGAATVLQAYYALIEVGKYADALKLRWDADQLGVHRFAAGFAPYAFLHATVGAPSAIEGAAGSVYVQVPVQLFGQLKSGKPFNRIERITLRRVNDVPGSTPEQRSWRIYRNE
jgi:hypothetical protein